MAGSRETGGAGLGLAIARRALLAAGGDLVAANRPAGGAEFTGWLPPHAETPAAHVPDGVHRELVVQPHRARDRIGQIDAARQLHAEAGR